MSLFKEAFCRGKLFDDVKLSDQNPCNTCLLVPKISEGTGFRRDENLVNKHCSNCFKYYNWQLNCVSKLSEYEKICISTKEIELKWNT